MGSKLIWAAIGVAAAAVAIGVGELVAGILNSASIVASIGALVISLQPPGAKDLMVEIFGTNDKLALEVAVFLGGLAAGAVIGLVAERNRWLGYAGVGLFGLVAFVLVLQDPLEDPLAAVLSVGAAVIAGLAMLNWLMSLASRSRPATAAAAAAASDETAEAELPEGPQPAPAGSLPRRSFLALSAMLVAAGGVLAVVGRFIGSQAPATAPLPQGSGPAETLPPIPAAANLDIPGLSPIVVPNDDFYRIDTRLTIPHLDVTGWNVRVFGMVDRELTLTYQDLVNMPQMERYVTIACVSNQVGGHLVGNTKWTGVSLNSVLEMAGVQQGATQVVGRSYDNWTCGFPTEHLAGAGHDAMIVLRMNDQPLPAAHGFPARLIVPGLYGYVSATKWLTEIEMTTLEAIDAYWVPLGWAKEAPIKTQSRIDVPRDGAGVTAGQVQFAGVAWAPTRGISKVEVSLDGGDWNECELSQPLSDYSWVQWQTTLPVNAGSHKVRVRATDGTGETQTADYSPPAPSGATGYHLIGFSAA